MAEHYYSQSFGWERLHRRALYIGLAIIAAVIAAGFYISLWRH